LSQDVDVNGDVDVDSIVDVDLARRLSENADVSSRTPPRVEVEVKVNE
jgi:hypothetical protein